jgi:hypothetical protein
MNMCYNEHGYGVARSDDSAETTLRIVAGSEFPVSFSVSLYPRVAVAGNRSSRPGDSKNRRYKACKCPNQNLAAFVPKGGE